MAKEDRKEDAGTVEPADAGQLEERAEELAGKSRQAQFSTYTRVDPPKTNPPGGPIVEQELGEPHDGPVEAFGSKSA